MDLSLKPQSISLKPDLLSRVRQNFDLSKTNWLRVGGCAQYFFKPENTQDLADFFKELPKEIPVTVLGVGSNIIVRDGGIDGVVVRLGRGFTEVSVSDCQLSVGAGMLDINVSIFAAENSLAGLEFLSGIPGTIGGAVRMNAGAYGRDISQVLVEAEIVERDGTIRRLSNSEIGFIYRNSKLPEGAIVTAVVLRGEAGDREEIVEMIEEINSKREETQPIRTRTGGSTFKNPDDYKAWELIDRAGCRGLTIGGAQMSELHCNFMINTGNATASDLENLGEEVIKRVFEKTGIMLEWEIKRIGKK
ncbi:MAG: UDP-N-acetylmuramate dehydrogenase [Pseudomonadota bacterium]